MCRWPTRAPLQCVYLCLASNFVAVDFLSRMLSTLPTCRGAQQRLSVWTICAGSPCADRPAQFHRQSLSCAAALFERLTHGCFPNRAVGLTRSCWSVCRAAADAPTVMAKVNFVSGNQPVGFMRRPWILLVHRQTA